MYSVANSGGKLSEATHFKNFALDGRGFSCAQGVAEPSLAADGPGLVEGLEKASLKDLGKRKREVTLSTGCPGGRKAPPKGLGVGALQGLTPTNCATDAPHQHSNADPFFIAKVRSPPTHKIH